MSNHANSIYNVREWQPYPTVSSYAKNDIVSRIEYLEGTAEGLKIPKNIKYYYNLNGINTSVAPEIDTTDWGGYTTVNSQKVPYFLWKPSYNLSTKHNPRVNVVQFGNGYQQRNPDGLFSQLISLDISFEKRTEQEARAILHFLKARKAVESFSIKELPDLYADNTTDGWRKRFVCPSFNSNFVFYNNYTITATFKQENN